MDPVRETDRKSSRCGIATIMDHRRSDWHTGGHPSSQWASGLGRYSLQPREAARTMDEVEMTESGARVMFVILELVVFAVALYCTAEATMPP